MAGLSVTASRDGTTNGMDVDIATRISKIDTSTFAGETVIGKAAPGTATSAARWRIYRFSATGEKTFRNGSTQFDQVWDNRGSGGTWT